MARPTEQQLRVIEHGEGRAVVFAVAGSGKTTTMGWRVERLTKKENVNPERIVATTFGKFARDQMRSKFDQLGVSPKVHTLTLHQFASRVITVANKKIQFKPRVAIGDTAKQWQTLRVAKANIIAQGIIQDPNICQRISDISFDDFDSILGKMKGALEFTHNCFQGLPPELQNISIIKYFDPSTSWLQELIDAYEIERINSRFRGYDDMLIDALEAVYCNQSMRADIENRFDYMIVDEYQDINKAQDELVKVCDRNRGNLMVIGDDDQTIYEWRGATPAFIRDKIQSTEWKQYYLDLNFRSCAPQVILAAQCIRKNRVRAEKKMQPTGDFSGDLKLIKCQSIQEQAKKIISIIQDKVDSGIPLGDQVILIRRYNQSLPIEKELIEHKIKYQIPGASFFFDTKEVQFVMSFLLLYKLEQRLLTEQRLPTPPERREYQSLLNQVTYRAQTYLNQVDRNIICNDALQINSSLTIELRTFASNNQNRNWTNALALAQFYETCEQPADLIFKDMLNRLQQTINIRQKIIERAPDPSIGIEQAAIILSLESFAGSKTLNEILDEVDDLRQFWVDGLKQVAPSEILRIYTVFKAKGLEFPVVYLPDINKQTNVTPNNNLPEISSGPEEERRIFYVAITRSIKDLYMFYSSQEPSEYLKEAKFENISAYHELTRSVLNTEERDCLDSLQIGRKFSIPSYVYETKYSFANIFAKESLSAQKNTIKDIDLAISYLKNEDNVSVGDQLRYEKLQKFWTEAGDLALEIRDLNSVDDDENLLPIAPPGARPIDPFDQMFAEI